MNYYDNQPDYLARGIDYDLIGCLNNNPQQFGGQPFNWDESWFLWDEPPPGTVHPDIQLIARVVAVVEGEAGGKGWHWLIDLTDGRRIYLSGECDMTGWDCQSSAAFVEVTGDLLESMRANPHVLESFERQLAGGKAPTWREQQDQEFAPTATHRAGR